MSESQLPKATMSNYIRDRIRDKKKVSAEFTIYMLDLSKCIGIITARVHRPGVCQGQ